MTPVQNLVAGTYRPNEPVVSGVWHQMQTARADRADSNIMLRLFLQAGVKTGHQSNKQTIQNTQNTKGIKSKTPTHKKR